MTLLNKNKASDIRNRCRENLLPFSRKAMAKLPPLTNPAILDAGCGSGVVSLDIAMTRTCRITAIDPDEEELALFRKNLSRLNPAGSIEILNASIFDSILDGSSFDWLIAEGLLNVTGFERGFSRLAGLSRPGGYIIIHDEVEKKEEKLAYTASLGWSLVDSFYLDENVWGKEYYRCLEASLGPLSAFNTDHDHIKEQFRKLEEEIADYKKNSLRFRSVFYILEKQ